VRFSRDLELAASPIVVCAVISPVRYGARIIAKDSHMAKKSLARKRQATTKRTTRSTASSSKRRAMSKRSASAGFMASDMFNPSTWASTLLGSQTGRKIVAEALVAAAAAAAAVLVATRTEAGQKAGRALVSAGKRGGEIAKEAALSAAAAAADVITDTATQALHTASKSMLANVLTDDEPADMAENARRQRDRHAH
jgi:hypothetical protein